MVSISTERAVETERRLRKVLAATEVVHLERTWGFRRFDGAAPPEALATVRDDDGWCALVPADDAGERFGITRLTFPVALDNSGFVGWLATTVKRRLGSGVFVICGDNPRRGGIFDYLGYPIEVAQEVRALIDELRAPERPDSLDLRLFHVAETSPASAVSSETTFEFRERAGVVQASYAGGEIVTGTLTGRRAGDRVAAAYAQLHADGELRTGTAELRIEGDVRLVEEYTWSDGTRGRNVLHAA